MMNFQFTSFVRTPFLLFGVYEHMYLPGTMDTVLELLCLHVIRDGIPHPAVPFSVRNGAAVHVSYQYVPGIILYLFFFLRDVSPVL